MADHICMNQLVPGDAQCQKCGVVVVPPYEESALGIHAIVVKDGKVTRVPLEFVLQIDPKEVLRGEEEVEEG